MTLQLMHSEFPYTYMRKIWFSFLSVCRVCVPFVRGKWYFMTSSEESYLPIGWRKAWPILRQNSVVLQCWQWNGRNAVTSVPEFIDLVFAKTSPKRARFQWLKNERFGLVLAKTGSINSGTEVLWANITVESANVVGSTDTFYYIQ